MKKKKILIIAAIMCTITLITLLTLILFSSKNADEQKIDEMSYSEAQELIRSNKDIISIKLNENSNNAYLYLGNEESLKTYVVLIPDVGVFTSFLEEYPDVEYEVLESSTIFISNQTILILIPYIIILICFVSCIRKFKKLLALDSKSSLIDSKLEILPKNISNYTFNDVAGIDNELSEIKEIVSMIKEPDKYREIGAIIPKGILLVGESGTGKTLIAKAIAGEAGGSFYMCNASSLESNVVGAGVSKVKKIFEEARKNAPSIIFIDDIDILAQNRYYLNSNTERTLNQLLAEMDVIDESENIIIIAATNHPEILDSVVSRPGRFERIIDIPLPNKKGRRDILEVNSRNKIFDENKNEILDELAKKTTDMSGADLANILNEAAIVAIQNGKKAIGKEEIDEAYIQVILGISKDDKEISQREKMLVAIHEAGHTLAGRIVNKERKILQVSIIPRGAAGGYTLLEDDENYLPTVEDFKNELIISLGGRAAEMHWFNTISTGASADLQDATIIAHQMIYAYAMGTGVQMVKVYGHNDYNSKLEDKMFPDMENLMEEAYNKTIEIMEKHHDLLEKIATMLCEKSTLNSTELEEIFTQYGV